MASEKNKKGKKQNIFVVDDHPIFRRGLIALISEEDSLNICGEAEAGLEALEKLKKTAPDLIILDIGLKDINGLDLIKRIHSLHKDIKILILSMHEEEIYGKRALRAGAQGYVMKGEDPNVFLKALQKILDGEIYISDRVNQQLLKGMRGTNSDLHAPPVETLTNRELEIFELVGQGFTNQQIAENLYIALKTVHAHKNHIVAKLGLKNASELVSEAHFYYQHRSTQGGDPPQ